VLWLDCDREGENICFEITGIVEKHLAKRPFQQIYRAKFSSITDKDIIYAFENLRDSPNENQSKSVDAR
jgi:DNA topoisomerase III